MNDAHEQERAFARTEKQFSIFVDISMKCVQNFISKQRSETTYFFCLSFVLRPFLRHNEREEEEVGKHKRTSMIRG